MMKISGRLRQTSTHMPAATLSGFQRDSRASASASPTISESTIAITAISRLTRKPSRMNRSVVAGDQPLPVVGVEEVAHRWIA